MLLLDFVVDECAATAFLRQRRVVGGEDLAYVGGIRGFQNRPSPTLVKIIWWVPPPSAIGKGPARVGHRPHCFRSDGGEIFVVSNCCQHRLGGCGNVLSLQAQVAATINEDSGERIPCQKSWLSVCDAMTGS